MVGLCVLKLFVLQVDDDTGLPAKCFTEILWQRAVRRDHDIFVNRFHVCTSFAEDVPWGASATQSMYGVITIRIRMTS